MNDNVPSWEEAVLWLRNQPDRQDLVRDCFYDDPLEKSAKRFHRSTEWRAVRKLLSSVAPGRVLDIGAGRGISSYAFAQDGWRVVALEPDPSKVVGAGAIRQLAEQGLDIEIIEESGEHLPFPDNSFDLVYGRAVLHHADDLASLCQEAGRVMKQGGIFLFTREHVLSCKADLERFFKSHALHFLYQGEYAFTLPEYLEALQSGGTKVTRIISPYDSDINLFPLSQQQLFSRVKGQWRLPFPNWFIRRCLLPQMNRKNNRPGRLYSFFGKKV